jgi:3-oxoacyl-[acyl-carrier protein] reductase
MSVVDGVDELEGDWFKGIYVEQGKLPLRRHAEPHEIAAHVAWLASEQNTYVTGQVLTVDGGLTVTF